jgi:hypothetical protein
VSQPDRVVELARLKLVTSGSFLQGVRGRIMTDLGTGPFGALHTKLYDAADGRRYALVTATATNEIIAVDVTNPRRPVQAGAIDAAIQFIEGIFVHRDHAFVGGFGNSAAYRAVDVSNPRRMRIVRSLEGEPYRQMVSAMSPERPDLLFAALWNDAGGLAIFDVRDPAHFTLVGQIVMPELARSNRVKLQGDWAFLPLQVDPGGFAAIDATDPRIPRLAFVTTPVPGISTPYTLEVREDHVYLFGSTEPKMAVFRLERGRRDPPRLWRFFLGTR